MDRDTALDLHGLKIEVVVSGVRLEGEIDFFGEDAHAKIGDWTVPLAHINAWRVTE